MTTPVFVASLFAFGADFLGGIIGAVALGGIALVVMFGEWGAVALWRWLWKPRGRRGPEDDAERP